ncbi:DUF2797 domain-containing protein [Actinomycetes bacterium M1A6_2h]
MSELVSGVLWPGREPLLSLYGVESRDTRIIGLTDASLTYRVVGEGRYCLGRSAPSAVGPPVHVPCPDQAPSVSGHQCENCASKDQFRFVHIVHRQDFVSRDIESVVMQPHWLYVATFAGGASKVGTAAEARKWGRLTEQGALVARYVAHATDGRVVRVLEDAITENTGLRQAVRASAKASALALPVDLDALDEINEKAAVRARAHVSSLPSGRFEIVDERWESPAGREILFGAPRRIAYPLDPGVGAHGFTIGACVGSAALVGVPSDPDAQYVADLSKLRGRRIEFGDYASDMPAVQGALF